MSVLRNASLRDYSYYGTGGPCFELCIPESDMELSAQLEHIRRRGWPLLILGGGTNSLVMDDPFPGAAILLRGFKHIENSNGRFLVGAGVDNSAVASAALAAGMAGAAWMYRLPGQLGGTVRMNARCYGGEVSQIVQAVKVVGADGAPRWHRNPSMFRGYKDTIFMDNGDIITQVELVLAPGDRAAIESDMRACERDRIGKGQFTYPSCGCVFKNDHSLGIPSGRLLEAAGVKGLVHRGAQVSLQHANFVFNKGATAREICELTLVMRDRVYDRFGVWMEYEMEILGLVPEDLRKRLDEARQQTWRLEDLANLKVLPGRNGQG